MALPPKKSQEKPMKKYYKVSIETLLPATISFRVLAESPEKAAEMIKNQNPVEVRHKLAGRRDKKITVYDWGTTIIRFFRNLF
jgi:hypothetical protein